MSTAAKAIVATIIEVILSSFRRRLLEKRAGERTYISEPREQAIRAEKHEQANREQAALIEAERIAAENRQRLQTSEPSNVPDAPNSPPADNATPPG